MLTLYQCVPSISKPYIYTSRSLIDFLEWITRCWWRAMKWYIHHMVMIYGWYIMSYHDIPYHIMLYHIIWYWQIMVSTTSYVVSAIPWMSGLYGVCMWIMVFTKLWYSQYYGIDHTMVLTMHMVLQLSHHLPSLRFDWTVQLQSYQNHQQTTSGRDFHEQLNWLMERVIRINQ